MRAALRVAAALVLLLLTAYPVTAADPTLGARLSPVEIVYERAEPLDVTNRSTVPVTVTLTASNGWTLGVSTLNLAIDERATVPVTRAGDGPTVIRATITPTDVIAGTDAASLVLETRARHLTPWEGIPLAPVGLVILVSAVTATAVLRHLRRPQYAGWTS